jgi:hypothetical protein
MGRELSERATVRRPTAYPPSEESAVQYRVIAALAAFTLAATSALADGTEPVGTPKVIVQLSGSVDDDRAEAPREPVLTGEKELAALWKAWKLADRRPRVDFAREFVLVSTTGGGSLDVVLRRDDRGDLRVSLQESQDSPPGLRYVIQVIPREGIKSVNGKKLKD